MSVLNFRGALKTYLLSDTGLSALIGGRLYAPPAPQAGSEPYVTFQRISGADDGNLTEATDKETDRWQFDIYARSVDDAEAVKSALFNALNYVLNTTMSIYFVYFSRRVGDYGNFEPEGDGSQSGWERITQDYEIRHKRTAST